MIPVTRQTLTSTRQRLVKTSISRKGAKTWFIRPHQNHSMMFLLRHLRLIRRLQHSMLPISRIEKYRWILRIILVGKAIAKKSLTTYTTKVKIIFLQLEYHVIFPQGWKKSVKIPSIPPSDRWELAKSPSNSTCISIMIGSMERAKVIFRIDHPQLTTSVDTQFQNTSRKT